MAKVVHDAVPVPHKQVFLLTCMDLRFLDDIVRFMNKLNLHNRYDHIVFAGAAFGVLKLSSPTQLHKPVKGKKSKSPSTAALPWKHVFFDHLLVAINTLKRDIHDIYIMEHLDCGAYKYFCKDYDKKVKTLKDEINLHSKMAHHLAIEIEAFCQEQQNYAEEDLKQYLNCVKKGVRDKRERSELANNIADATWRKEAWEGINVSCFLMDLSGDVKPMN